MAAAPSSRALRIVFSGASGRMGRALLPGLRATAGIEVVAEVSLGDDLVRTARAQHADVVIDFTAPSVAVAHARAILEAGAYGVIGTTGFTAADLDALDAEARAQRRGLLVAPNFSLGVVLMQRFADEAVRHFPRVEIVETHHEQKVDAPSGTARATAERLAAGGARGGPGGTEPALGDRTSGVAVHSLRLPGIQARQEVHFAAAGETLVLRHDALSRECYLPGVVAAVRAIPGRIGLLRGLESVLFGGPP